MQWREEGGLLDTLLQNVFKTFLCKIMFPFLNIFRGAGSHGHDATDFSHLNQLRELSKSLGLEVKRYGPVCHTDTSLAAWKAYWHFFLKKDPPLCLQAVFRDLMQLVADVCIDQWPK